MTARNMIRGLLEESGGAPTERVCAWVRWLTCSEGQTVEELFPANEAQAIVSQCSLVCSLEPQDPPFAA
jgi:hypothetical protein